jgi:hypothetical protein
MLIDINLDLFNSFYQACRILEWIYGIRG